MNIEQLSQEIEQVSRIYADEFSIERDANWFILKLQEEVGELIQSYLMLSGKARTKGKSVSEIESDFRQEVADVFCQVLLLTHFYDIDLEKEVKEKWLSLNKK